MPMPIAILDDGVSYRAIPDLAFRMETVNGEVKPANADGAYRGHGTTCARILRAYEPKIPLGSVRVLAGHSGRGLVENLIAAVRWCAAEGIRLANVSLGSVEERDRAPIQEAVEEARKKGLILVCATSNDGLPSWPACLDGAIGVEADEELVGDQWRPHPSPERGLELLASARHTVVINNIAFKPPVCNSFAAPTATLQIWRMLEKEPYLSVEDILKRIGKG